LAAKGSGEANLVEETNGRDIISVGPTVLTNYRLLFALLASMRLRRLISAKKHNHILEKPCPGSSHIYWVGEYELISTDETSMIA
jgi:hypothetical protein